MRVGNSNFITKRVAEGGYGAEDDTLLATELHRFIHEYDDADPLRSGWFMHRLELLINEILATAPTPSGAPADTTKARILDKGFRYDSDEALHNQQAIPTVLVGFPVNDYDSRDAFAATLTPLAVQDATPMKGQQ